MSFSAYREAGDLVGQMDQMGYMGPSVDEGATHGTMDDGGSLFGGEGDVDDPFVGHIGDEGHDNQYSPAAHTVPAPPEQNNNSQGEPVPADELPIPKFP